MKKALKTTKTAASQKVAQLGRRVRLPSGESGATGSSCVSTSSESPGRPCSGSRSLFPGTALNQPFGLLQRIGGPHWPKAKCNKRLENRRNFTAFQTEVRLTDSYRFSTRPSRHAPQRRT